MAGYGNKYLRKSEEQTRITAQQVEESVNGSLARLGTDYIDLLQVTPWRGCLPLHEQGTVLASSSIGEESETPV